MRSIYRLFVLYLSLSCNILNISLHIVEIEKKILAWGFSNVINKLTQDNNSIDLKLNSLNDFYS